MRRIGIDPLRQTQFLVGDANGGLVHDGQYNFLDTAASEQLMIIPMMKITKIELKNFIVNGLDDKVLLKLKNIDSDVFDAAE